MTLPKKKSRLIRVDGILYRWRVSVHQHVLNLTVEAEEERGQTLQAFFEPHDQYKRESDGKWSFHRQGRSLTPNDVSRIIRHGLANDWQPHAKGRSPIQFHTWDTDRITSSTVDTKVDEVALRDVSIDQVSNLRLDLSLDSHWRKTLFNAKPLKRFILPADYFGIGHRARECGLRFAVFNDGYTECGFIVFGIESVDFPDVVMYTTNNPAII